MKRQLPDTSWSLLKTASSGDDAALERFVALYRPVITDFIAARFRLSADHAEDLAQDFLVNRVIESDWLTRADPARGRFRNLLLVSLRNFILNELRREAARLKTMQRLELEAQNGMPSREDVHSFDVAWAENLLEFAFAATQQRCEEAGQERFWRLFEMRILEPIMNDTQPPSYADCIEDCGFESVSQACNAIATVNRRLNRALRAALGTYCAENDLDEELAALRESVSRNPLSLDRVAKSVGATE
jgi:DNA-directed RNA polymerase specialized sigma24 family protein